MTPEHEALINHLTSGTCCHAPSGRYCETGRELWMAYRVQCVAVGGRELMQMVRHQTPEWADEIKRRVMVAMNANRN